MTTARDELVDVIAEAYAKAEYESVGHDLTKYPWDEVTANEAHKARYREDGARVAPGILAALVERYGEPEINTRTQVWHTKPPTKARRLVFPWQPIQQEGELP